MLNKINASGGDMGRGITIYKDTLPTVMRIISEFMPHLTRLSNRLMYAYAIEVPSGSEQDLEDKIKTWADQYSLDLYDSNGRVLFDIKDSGGGILHKRIFYIIKRGKDK